LETIDSPDLSTLLASSTVQLRPSEHSRDQIEKQCLIALRLLKALTTTSGWGFDTRDAKSPFITSCLNQPKALSTSQLKSLWNVVQKYQDQFQKLGFELPEQGRVAAFLSQKEEVRATVASARIQLDITEDKRWLLVHMPHYRAEWKKSLDEFRTEFANQAMKNAESWFDEQRGKPRYDPATFTWHFPCSLTIYKAMTNKKFFPLSTVDLLPGAQRYQANIEEEEFAVVLRLEQETEKKRRRYQELLTAMGGLDVVFGQGKRLYKHQKEAVDILLKKDFFLIADETGLGKTLEAAWAAVARQRADGVRIYVITTVSSMDMWEETFAELGASCEVFSWASIPLSDAEYPPQRYVLIADEAHKACNESAKCTQRFLDLAQHENCVACYAMTGTPVPNGRPVNLYTLLLAMRHPLVWHKSSLLRDRMKYAYLERYCGRHRKHIGSGTYVWDNNGATYLWDLNRRIAYIPGAPDNHRDACQIARLKIDCTDLPEKQRSMQPVEMTDEARKIFQDAVIRLWDQFESNVKAKLVQFAADFRALEGRDPSKSDLAGKEKKIRRAEAVVSYGIFRQAGGFAKIEHAVEQSQVICDGGKHKLVIFTSFKEVAKQLGAKLAEIYGADRIGYIMDEVSREERTAQMKDFQSKGGRLLIMISTAAGGEAITLTEAQHMLIIDRPWTPGRVKQWEDRIHRLTTTGTVTIYWLQLPKDLSDADIRVDKMLQAKQINIDAIQYGIVSAGMHFASDEELADSAETIIRDTRKRIRRKKQQTKVAA
jgi:SNF2 family DNA or RNA helicase